MVRALTCCAYIGWFCCWKIHLARQMLNGLLTASFALFVHTQHSTHTNTGSKLLRPFCPLRFSFVAWCLIFFRFEKKKKCFKIAMQLQRQPIYCESNSIKWQIVRIVWIVQIEPNQNRNHFFSSLHYNIDYTVHICIVAL